MPSYKLTGWLEEAAKVLVFNESDWSLEKTEDLPAGDFVIGNLSAGAKMAAGRRNTDGKVEVYGNITPELIINSFKFQIVNASPFTLPIAAGGAGFAHNFTVNWGDGTPDSTITSFDDADATHNYVSPGTYDITMTGLCEYFAFNNTGSKLQLRKLLEFNGDVGFKTLNFNGCANLNTIIPLATMASLNNASWLFGRCTSITSIPIDMFRYCPAVTDFSYIFAVTPRQTTFTSIPADLFRYNAAATTFQATFLNCLGITSASIPTDLFRYNTLVTNFRSTFGFCNLSSIPVDLFRYNTLVIDFGSVFGGNNNLVTIPVDLFRYNTLVTNFGAVFYNCASLVLIPVDLFRYNTLVIDFNTAFGNTSVLNQLTEVPIDLFRYNTLVTSFFSVFWNCQIAVLPGDVFIYNLVAVNFQQAFYNNYAMTGLGQTIIDNTSLPGHSVPTNTNDCFFGCTSLSDYATIPVAWK